MGIKNYVDVTIESDIFAGVRESFNTMIQKLLYKMQQNAADEGKITLSVNIDMTTEWIPDGNGESEECQKPKLKYKVDYSVPVKEGMDGKKDPGMKIVYDEHLRKFVLKYVNEGGQMSMFDDEIQDTYPTESEVVDSTPAIAGPAADENALPGEVMEPEEPDSEESDQQDEVVEPEDSMNPPEEMPDDYDYEDPEENADEV